MVQNTVGIEGTRPATPGEESIGGVSGASRMETVTAIHWTEIIAGIKDSARCFSRGVFLTTFFFGGYYVYSCADSRSVCADKTLRTWRES